MGETEEMAGLPTSFIWMLVVIFVLVAIAVALVLSGTNIGAYVRSFLSLIFKG
jgi:hypothetical protein